MAQAVGAGLGLEEVGLIALGLVDIVFGSRFGDLRERRLLSRARSGLGISHQPSVVQLAEQVAGVELALAVGLVRALSKLPVVETWA